MLFVGSYCESSSRSSVTVCPKQPGFGDDARHVLVDGDRRDVLQLERREDLRLRLRVHRHDVEGRVEDGSEDPGRVRLGDDVDRGGIGERDGRRRDAGVVELRVLARAVLASDVSSQGSSCAPASAAASAAVCSFRCAWYQEPTSTTSAAMPTRP